MCSKETNGSVQHLTFKENQKPNNKDVKLLTVKGLQVFLLKKLRSNYSEAIYSSCFREEQDLLDILDLKLFDVRILVSILIGPHLESLILLDSCLVWRKEFTFLLDSCLVRNMYWQSCLILAWRYFENWTLYWTYLDRFYKM